MHLFSCFTNIVFKTKNKTKQKKAIFFHISFLNENRMTKRSTFTPTFVPIYLTYLLYLSVGQIILIQVLDVNLLDYCALIEITDVIFL